MIEIIGQFGVMNKITSFQIPGCSSDFNFSAILKLKSSLNLGQEVHFQLATIYTDSMNNRFIRTINYKIKACDDIELIYKSIDNCALTKITLIQAINIMKEKSLEEARKYLENTLIEILYFYRKTVNIL